MMPILVKDDDIRSGTEANTVTAGYSTGITGLMNLYNAI